ncbi:hypothetical protein CL97_gp162 [Cronobacter phage CR9]|uniref:Uncharacterized protein n=1 Tax=Cronobacter phage CR9 TaxID=1162290 RepID=M1F2C8_9CAUD|nr:hypothetical protein CL97_gp162 [Cronobacter phage CR9]AFH21046.1 hypothetical protein CR9_162 [Cronobacter phage CR9]
MQKANTLFILADVADHVVASLSNVAGTVRIICRHMDDKEPNRLQINVDRKGADFVISYDAIYNGRRFMQAKSDPIPASYIQEAIATLVNDTIPAGAMLP